MPGVIKSCILKLEKAIAQQLNLHWVKFKLQDDKGQPMADVVVKVKLPDNTYEVATSNQQGMIEIKNLKPGTCSIDLSFEGQSSETTVFLQ
jgi:hypothetical protein